MMLVTAGLFLAATLLLRAGAVYYWNAWRAA